jgi:peptidase M50B-like protein
MGSAVAIPVAPGSWPVVVGGIVALGLVLLTGTWAGSVVTVAHEGGHVVLALLSGRDPGGFVVNEDTGGGATAFRGGWGVSLVFVYLAGYPTPPLLGLAGAHLVVDGRSWSVLWAALVLLGGSLLHARGLFTNLIVVLAGVGIGWAAVRGGPDVQAPVAAALVWWLLLGGVRALLPLGLGGDASSDAGQLARCTWVPAVVWVAVFWAAALACLWAGGGRMLGL